MGFLWAVFKLGLLGGGISSVVIPSLIAAGYKDYNGHGKPNNPSTKSNSNWKPSTNTSNDILKNNSDKTKKIGENASKVAKSYGINVGRIPWRTKISGKLGSKCNGSSGNNINLGNDKWTPGKTNWHTNKNLFGEVQFNCQNKSGTLFLKWEGGSQAKKGWYGRVEFQK